jgi:hypothetical protein
MKDVQATGEPIKPQKRTSSTSKPEISKLFKNIFVGHDFFLSWIRIQPNIINSADPDPKPWETSSILCCNLVIEGLKFVERNAVMLMLRSHYTDCTHAFKQSLPAFLCVLFFSL